MTDIVGDIAGVEQGLHRDTVELVHVAVDGGDPRHSSAVIADAPHALLGRDAGGDGRRQDQHVLVLEGVMDVFPEDEHAVGLLVFPQDIDVPSRVHGAVAVPGQLLGQAGADGHGAVHAQDGIDGGEPELSRQLLSNGVCAFKAAPLGGYVKEVIGVAVPGGKMAFCDLQGYVSHACRELIKV